MVSRARVSHPRLRVILTLPALLPANHFIEWQADYHHPTLSSSLFHHGGYPTQAERTRFFRAYLGTDQGRDDPSPSTASTTGAPAERAVSANEELRLAHLEDEVRIWAPASHAQWAAWGIVQVREDLQNHIKGWRRAYERSRGEGEGGGGKEEEEAVPAGEFDYLHYSLGRITMFRRELKGLGIVE